ncbi:hypothetical protein JKP88DRAFT_251350 [Tribonema minus]|uniref:Uncharacterized protein n=1 Tax=Tribonema minus TaxID=303371 RepID=A0A835ZC59_9STRA|nr:hypothetical protein JKP88DRAFT_251350 [Tribonema minus]
MVCTRSFALIIAALAVGSSSSFVIVGNRGALANRQQQYMSSGVERDVKKAGEQAKDAVGSARNSASKGYGKAGNYLDNLASDATHKAEDATHKVEGAAMNTQTKAKGVVGKASGYLGGLKSDVAETAEEATHKAEGAALDTQSKAKGVIGKAASYLDDLKQ